MIPRAEPGEQVNSKDWPWSSFSFYAKNEAGLAGIDAVDL